MTLMEEQPTVELSFQLEEGQKTLVRKEEEALAKTIRRLELLVCPSRPWKKLLPCRFDCRNYRNNNKAGNGCPRHRPFDPWPNWCTKRRTAMPFLYSNSCKVFSIKNCSNVKCDNGMWNKFNKPNKPHSMSLVS